MPFVPEIPGMLARPLPISGPVATVIVLFHPSTADIENLTRLAEWGYNVVAVVNSMAPGDRRSLTAAGGLRFIHNDHNLGLAHALNQGLAAAIAKGADHVLLLDQDSRPPRDMLPRLSAAARVIEDEGRRLACVAPVLIDRKLAGAALTPTESGGTLATSGSLVTRQAWEEVGPMWDDLFIDGIDHEWCFRAQAKGFETVVTPDVVMEHDMGDLAVNFFGRFKPIHRSPVRHYFIVRNTLWLLRRSYIPWSWRVRELAKLAYRAPIYALVSHDRMRSVRNILGAIGDGLSMRAGRQANVITQGRKNT
jgi:rhamnosyltransferase